MVVPILLIFVLVALPIFFFFLFLVQNHKYSNDNLHLPPGPKGLPLIGNLHQLDNSDLPRHLWRLSKKYGPVMFLRLGFKPTLVVSSAKMAMEVLKTQDLDFCSRPTLRGQQTLSYKGLDLAFSPYGTYYREVRKICVLHLFSSTRVQTYRPVRESEVSILLKKISKLADHDEDEPVNLSEAVTFFTSNLICRIALGKSYEDDEDDGINRFRCLLSETEALFMTNFFSDYFPYMSWVDRITGLMSRLERNFKEFDDFYDEIIKEHLDPKRPEQEREDILDVLLQLWKNRSFKVDLTLDHIKAILMVIYEKLQPAPLSRPSKILSILSYLIMTLVYLFF